MLGQPHLPPYFKPYPRPCQELVNLVTNGGMEGVYVDGGAGGFLMVAPGWTQNGCEDDGTDLLSRDAGIFHSGLYSQKVDVNANAEGVRTAGDVFTSGKWHLVTIWLYATDGDVWIMDGGISYLDEIVTPPAAWTEYSFIVKALSSKPLYIRSSGGAANFNIDDVCVNAL